MEEKMGSDIKTADDFRDFVKGFESQEGYRKPMAFGIGIANVSDAGDILDTFFPFPNHMSNLGSAAVLAKVVGHLAGTQTYLVSLDQRDEILSYFAPFEGDGKRHGNIDAIKAAFDVVDGFKKKHGDGKIVVVSFIDQSDHDEGPQSVGDAYLRLHLLSHRLVKPNEVKLDGIFGKLPKNVWTNEGPIAPADLPKRQLDAMMRRHSIHVNAVDKFPRMVDYVVPSGVRIADASRVRLGAYLGDGTTVMHEGFVNFNAGTITDPRTDDYEPGCMIEGRISAGVVVGDKSDLGGSASIMGTLSGGGKEKIKVGRGCLIGANAGTGISLGDKCVIEAGTYIKASTKVTYKGKVVKALELSGVFGLTFCRDSTTGVVHAIDKPNNVELNDELHKN